MAVLMCILSALFHTLSNIFMKNLDDVGPFTIVAARFLVILIAVLPIVKYRNDNPFPKGNRFLLLARSILGSITNIITYFAIKHMPLADVDIISATGAVFACVPSKIFLQEEITVSHIINIVANIIGMILVVKPSFAMDDMSNTKSSLLANDAVQSTAIGCIILSALFCQSNTFVLEKQLKDLHVTTPMTCFATVGFLTSSMMSLLFHDNVLPTATSDIFVLLIGGIFGLLGQFFTTMALKLESAGKVALTVKSTQILFSFIFQGLLFDDRFTTSSIVGASIILISLTVCDVRGDNRRKSD